MQNISAYPFENCLFQIKRLLRNGHRPLAQAANRLVELSSMNQIHENSKQHYPFVAQEDCFAQHELSTCNKVFNKICLVDGFTLINNMKHKWFMTKNWKIVEMKNATYFRDKLCIYGACITDINNFFERPLNSSRLDIFGSTLKNKTVAQIFHLNNIKYKLVAFNYCKETVFFPLIHTHL